MLIFIICYVIVAILVGRRMGWQLYQIDYQSDLGLNAFAGMVLGLMWPFVLPIMLGTSFNARHPDIAKRVFFSEPKRARKQRQLAAAQRRVNQLERELGLDDG